MTANNRFRFEPLGSHHDRAAFTCGIEALDRYLRQQARQDERRRVARVRILYDQDANQIAGYYTLSAAALRFTELPDEIARRLPPYQDVPALLIGRLALATTYQGRGVGGMLLFDALSRCREVTDLAAAVLVIVDAKNDAARLFYERAGFQRLVDQEFRLYLPVADIPVT